MLLGDIDEALKKKVVDSGYSQETIWHTSYPQDYLGANLSIMNMEQAVHPRVKHISELLMRLILIRVITPLSTKVLLPIGVGWGVWRGGGQPSSPCSPL